MPMRSRSDSATPSGSAILADVFPYGSCTTATMDLDHTRPYVPMIKGGPPGQTSLTGLGPMTRHHHRTVTHGGWQKTQPCPGQFVFRSPTSRTTWSPTTAPNPSAPPPSPNESGVPPAAQHLPE